jgi:hypothetical protein
MADNVLIYKYVVKTSRAGALNSSERRTRLSDADIVLSFFDG